MAETDRRRPEDRTGAMRTALAGLAIGTDPRNLVLQLDALHAKGSLFSGFVLLELAADALELSSASRAEPVEYDGIRVRHLPEIDIRGKYQHRKSHSIVSESRRTTRRFAVLVGASSSSDSPSSPS